MVDGNSQIFLGDSHPGPFSLPLSLDSAFLQSQPRQAFCGDSEGWGPMSPSRFDLTPCFLDVGVAIVAGWGLLMGAGAIWFLLSKRIAQPVSKNWHFYAKLVSRNCCFLSMALVLCESEMLICESRFRAL